MATATLPKLENPRNGSDLELQSTGDVVTDQIPASSGGSGEEPEGTTAAEAARTDDAEHDGAATDVQKKMNRAERFGVAVQLSEEEKRNSRAERFGTGSPANKVDSIKPSEELKRKSRAERFGIVQSDSSDADAKKKARLARFGSLSKADPVEEDKRKARGIRFSQPDSGSKANGKENVEVATAIAGKAGEGT